MQDYPFLRQVQSPVTGDQLRPLDPRCRVVQFCSPLTEADFRKLARFLEGYPEIPLRIYWNGGEWGRAEDLSFLRHFPSLRGFQADLYEAPSWEGLAFLPDTLEFLALGATRRTFSLGPLTRFPHLRELALEGHGKDLAVLAELRKLESLTLRSISFLRDPAPLLALPRLRGLALKLGGVKDLSFLLGLPGLRYLELWKVRGVADLAPVAELAELRYLFLQDLKQVAALPAFDHLRRLRRCHLENLSGVSDLSPLASAPALEELVVLNAKQLPVASFAPFRGHPTLKAATIALGSLRRNADAAALLGLPPAPAAPPLSAYLPGEPAP